MLGSPKSDRHARIRIANRLPTAPVCPGPSPPETVLAGVDGVSLTGLAHLDNVVVAEPVLIQLGLPIAIDDYISFQDQGTKFCFVIVFLQVNMAIPFPPIKIRM